MALPCSGAKSMAVKRLREVPADASYRQRRRADYPRVEDQLDAIWKQINQDRLGGKNLIQEADDLLNRVLAVKARHPKPASAKAKSGNA